MNHHNEYILRFVNSKDIRDHLRNIGYTLHRLLIPTAAFIKGEIDECLFARAYRVIALEYQKQHLFPCEYTEESLRLAGITGVKCP